MELKNFFAQDTKGNVVPFATVTVYNQGTTVMPTLYGPDGIAITNPFNVGNTGLAQFRAANGEYDVKVITGDGEYTLTMQCNDVTDSVDAAGAEADRAEAGADRAETEADRAQTYPGYVPPIDVTASKTLASGDANTEQQCNNASAIVITVPTDAAVPYFTGAKIAFIRVGAGGVTIQGDAGVSINGVSGGTAEVLSQYSAAIITNVGADAWVVNGAISGVV